MACKAAPTSDDYPPTEGCVRAATIISGWWLEELEPPSKGCLAHFLLESDFKISLFIQKQVAPRASNYAARLQEYVKTMPILENGSSAQEAAEGANVEDV